MFLINMPFEYCIINIVNIKYVQRIHNKQVVIQQTYLAL